MHSIQPLIKQDALEIAGWKYDPPYDIYDHRPEEIEKDLRYMLDPANGFFGIRAADGEVIGFCSFGKDAQVPGGEYDGDALDIGLGLRPDRTGQGLGPAVIGEVREFAGRMYRPARFRVTIASFNIRARRAWEKAGFIEAAEFTRPIDGRKFIILMREN
ncbi:MAG: GNAT family N-acetyltransferase [Anaerolineales bacterium]